MTEKLDSLGRTESEQMADLMVQVKTQPVDRSVERFEVDNIGQDDVPQFRAVVKVARMRSYEEARLATKAISMMIRGEW